MGAKILVILRMRLRAVPLNDCQRLAMKPQIIQRNQLTSKLILIHIKDNMKLLQEFDTQYDDIVKHTGVK